MKAQGFNLGLNLGTAGGGGGGRSSPSPYRAALGGGHEFHAGAGQDPLALGGIGDALREADRGAGAPNGLKLWPTRFHQPELDRAAAAEKERDGLRRQRRCLFLVAFAILTVVLIGLGSYLLFSGGSQPTKLPIEDLPPAQLAEVQQRVDQFESTPPTPSYTPSPTHPQPSPRLPRNPPRRRPRRAAPSPCPAPRLMV